MLPEEPNVFRALADFVLALSYLILHLPCPSVPAGSFSLPFFCFSRCFTFPPTRWHGRSLPQLLVTRSGPSAAHPSDRARRYHHPSSRTSASRPVWPNICCDKKATVADADDADDAAPRRRFRRVRRLLLRVELAAQHRRGEAEWLQLCRRSYVYPHPFPLQTTQGECANAVESCAAVDPVALPWQLTHRMWMRIIMLFPESWWEEWLEYGPSPALLLKDRHG